jgi:hypothetical protein
MTPRSGLGMTPARVLRTALAMSAPKLAQNDCPQAPGFRTHLRTLILHEACETAGGIGPLAGLLGVSGATLLAWLEGRGEAPEAVYQACIDIVLLHEPDRTSG